MKHILKITILLLGMFLATQFIGLYVIDHYQAEDKQLPFGMEPPEEAEMDCDINSFSDFLKCTKFLYAILFAFIIAISLLFFLTKFNAEFILKLWFFSVVIIALGISFNSILPEFHYSQIVVLAIALPLAFFKIYKRDFIVHNLTELFIYPGIAAVFVPILNIYTIIFLLILISGYDMWAVWHSGLMQKMAKYQITKLKIFSGFFVPYVSKKVKLQMKKMKKSESKKKKIRVNAAILGGGDVVFPIIAAGVMLKSFGFFSALFVILGAALGLSYLFFFAEKKKFYPAMPYITAGIFLGMAVSYFI